MSKEPNRNVYVGHRYVPLIMGEWDKSNDYEGLSIVTHKGASYTSKKRVPVGIDIENNEFWVLTGNYDSQVENYRQEMNNTKTKMENDMTVLENDLNENFDDMKETTFKGIDKVNKLGNTFLRQSKKGSLVILDDDLRNQSYDILFDFAKRKNIKVNMAVITDRLMSQASNTVTIEQFEEMKKSGIVEFVNHTHTHARLTDLNENQIIDELEKSENFLTSHGIFSNHLVYPYGAINEEVKEIVSRYFKSASKSNGLNINPAEEVLDTLQLNRIVFEEEEGTFKNRIDQASRNGGTVLINTHSQYETFDISKLERIVDMAIDSGLEILHFSEAFEKFKNPIELRDDTGDLIGGISAQGVQTGIFNTELRHINLGDTLLNNNSLPDEYENRVITSFNITNAFKEERNFPVSGRLFNFRSGSDGYTYQLINEVNTGHVYKRFWDTSFSRWSPWLNTSDSQKDIRQLTVANTSINNDSPPDEYENRMITSFNITSNIKEERSFPVIGRLFNFRSGADDYTYQLIHEFRSYSVYKRFWDISNEKWSEWVNIVESEKYKFVEENIEIASKQWKNLTLDVPNLNIDDVVVCTFRPVLSNEIIVSPPYISSDNKIRIRINNLSDTIFTLDKLNINLRKI